MVSLSLFSLCMCRENAKINPNKKYDVLKTIEKIVNNNIRPWKSAVRCWFVGSVCIVVVLYQKLYVCCLFFSFIAVILFSEMESQKKPTDFWIFTQANCLGKIYSWKGGGGGKRKLMEKKENRKVDHHSLWNKFKVILKHKHGYNINMCICVLTSYTIYT